MTQHEQIVQAYETYIAENAKFTEKGVKAAAARARKALQEMSKGIKDHDKMRAFVAAVRAADLAGNEG